jgi:hypothetical protein
MKNILVMLLLCCLFFAVPALAQEQVVPAEPRPVDVRSLEQRVLKLEEKVAKQQSEIDLLRHKQENHEKLFSKITHLLEVMRDSKQIENMGKSLKKIEDNLQKLLPHRAPPDLKCPPPAPQEKPKIPPAPSESIA